MSRGNLTFAIIVIFALIAWAGRDFSDLEERIETLEASGKCSQNSQVRD